jgi:hypothetical protein
MHSKTFTQVSPQFPAEHMSNDLLFSLRPESSRTSLNCEIVAQSADEVQDVHNTPPLSITALM